MKNKISLVGDSFNPNNIQVNNPQELDTVNNKRIWTTDKVNAYLDLMNRGREDTNNSPFFENEIGWRKGGVAFEYTNDEWEEFIKCSDDIDRFAQKYCEIKTGEQFTNFNLYPYQKKFFNTVINNKSVVYLASRQIGKCVTPDIKVDIKIMDKCYNDTPLINLYKYLDTTHNKGLLKRIKNILWKLYAIL